MRRWGGKVKPAADATGARSRPLGVAFDRRLKLEFHGARITPDAGRLAGSEDVDDAERLAHDPAIRPIVGREGLDRPAASTSEMGRWETEWLATKANLAALTDLSGARIVRHGRQEIFRLAVVAVARSLFAKILHRLDRLRGSPAPTA